MKFSSLCEFSFNCWKWCEFASKKLCHRRNLPAFFESTGENKFIQSSHFLFLGIKFLKIYENCRRNRWQVFFKKLCCYIAIKINLGILQYSSGQCLWKTPECAWFWNCHSNFIPKLKCFDHQPFSKQSIHIFTGDYMYISTEVTTRKRSDQQLFRNFGKFWGNHSWLSPFFQQKWISQRIFFYEFRHAFSTQSSIYDGAFLWK